MKKTLILILIILLLITIGYMLFDSLHIGGLKILGLKALNDENKKLDSSIQNLSKLSSVVYQQAITDVTKSAKDYESAKSEYDQIVEISTSNEIVTANQLQKYEIEYLWAKIGKHATDEDVLLKIEVSENSTSAATGYYDLNFTAEGDYVGITDFIYDIENDSSLGFKIEKFKMESLVKDENNQNTNNQQQNTNTTSGEKNEEEIKNKIIATFTCSNIAINIDSSLIVKPENKETENTNNETNENTSNNNTNTNSTNTTVTNTTY